ncbi:MAG: DUF3341 domain-containing protein [Planctomycetes bacterium]|nr:DUF3341 domain-containing protein [Planctomycetota bacterium]
MAERLAPPPRRIKLLVGVFEQETGLLAAARAAREQNLPVYDAYTPYAVHGLDAAMGLPRTRLPTVCFFCGLAGLAAALAFQLWTATSNWPMNVGGKPFHSLPALVPVSFETAVLLASLATVLAFFLRARLWPGRSPVSLANGVTDDRFVLALGPAVTFDPRAGEVLRQHGAVEIREIEAAP